MLCENSGRLTPGPGLIGATDPGPSGVTASADRGACARRQSARLGVHIARDRVHDLELALDSLCNRTGTPPGAIQQRNGIRWPLPAQRSRSTTCCHGSRTPAAAVRVTRSPWVSGRWQRGRIPIPRSARARSTTPDRIIEEVLLTVGEVLGRFYPDGWFTENMKRLIDDLHELRRSSPIDPIALSRL
jgi:hypothetical protein